MAIALTVPSIVCEGCVDTVTQAIKQVDAGAKVDISLTTKRVVVATEASFDTIKEAIAGTGHTVEKQE